MRTCLYNNKRSLFDSRSPVNYMVIFILLSLLGVLSMIREVEASEQIGDGTVAVTVDFDSSNVYPLPLYWKPSITIEKAHSSSMPPGQELSKFDQDVNSKTGFLRIRLRMDQLPDISPYPSGQSIKPGSNFINIIKDWQTNGGQVIVELSHLPLGPWVYDEEAEEWKWEYDMLNDSCLAICEDDAIYDSLSYASEWEEEDCKRIICGRYRPGDWDEYEDLMIDLIKYLTLKPKIGRTVRNNLLFGNQISYNTQGIEDLYFLFWAEPNNYRNIDDWKASWYDEWPQYLKLYDHFVSAVYEVEEIDTLPAVGIKVGGPKFYNGNDYEESGHALNDAASFVSFLQGYRDTTNDYKWEASCFGDTGADYNYKYPELPLRLDFMTRQQRTNDHQLVSEDRIKWFFQDFSGADCETLYLVHSPPLEYDCTPPCTSNMWDSNFYKKFEYGSYGSGEDYPYDDIEWYSFNVRSRANGMVEDFILSENSDTTYDYDCDDDSCYSGALIYADCIYSGVDVDNHMGAVNFLAQTWDHFEDDSQATYRDTTTLSNDMIGLWAEFWADPQGRNVPSGTYPECWPNHDINNDNDKGSWDYGFYKGGAGMLYTNSMDLNMYEMNGQYPVSVKKPFYNIVQMLGMLEDQQVEVENDTTRVNENNDWVRYIVTRNGSANKKIAILWWYYREPEDLHWDLFNETPPETTWLYSDFMDYIDNYSDIFTLYFDMILKGLPSDCFYALKRYVVDEKRSNGWTYRKQIYDYYRAEIDSAAADSAGAAKAAVLSINDWTSGDNDCLDPYDDSCSVALEMVETDTLKAESGEITLSYVADSPWVAILYVLERTNQPCQ